MMRSIFKYIAIFGAIILGAQSCIVDDTQDIDVGAGEGTTVSTSTLLNPSCVVEPCDVTRAKEAGIVVRALIDKVTSKQMESNFLRIDEDRDSQNDGLYTFTGNTTASYKTNWNKAILLEANVAGNSVIGTTPENKTVYYRSVSLEPIQSYSMNIVGEGDKRDTTHFYHTRMVGWYPQNCVLPRKEGVPATAQFEYSAFDAVRLNETIEINGVPTEVVALQFTGLDGETDLMVSNVREGQSWHLYNADAPHNSDVHPNDDSNIYRQPFGHRTASPAYSNHFTYRHYRSAIRLAATAENSDQNLMMWGKIEKVIIRNQPTSCKVWLPTEIGQFGDVYHWGDYSNHPIICTPMFNDSEHPGFNEAATYPINLEGESLDDDIYLGYSLIQPNRNVELEIHTSSGVYITTIEAKYKVKDAQGKETEVDIFEAGYIYNVKLNFQTNGTIGAILERESNERYYDLSSLHEYQHEDDHTANIAAFKLANCYIVDAARVSESENGAQFDGYCFFAKIIGNGKAGILTSGAQTMYPTSEVIHPVSAHLLWESQLGLITDVELKFEYVRFKLPNPNATGNAVIAVYDENDKILWSWHIWITSSPSTQSFALDDHTITFLDRNLGATAATCSNANNALATYGLYYQWGRKDPSMGPPTYNYSPINLNTAPYYDFTSDEKTAAEVAQFAQPTLQNSVENPMYLILPTSQTLSYAFNWSYQRYDFLWGYREATGMTSKTIYDPCPYGYRVPSSELAALFSMGSGSAGTYGYTRTVNNVQFFFPYTGFKGVDVGLNSLICSWKYVGQKGDYQSSMYCTNADAENSGVGVINLYMHRSRIYVSKANSWGETNVGNYSGNLHIDYANRRTAAPIRCVKDETIGSITALIEPSSRTLVEGETITIDYSAHSYGSAIESYTITASYKTTSGESKVREVRKVDNYGGYEIKDSISFINPTDCDDGGVTFTLAVKNEHGLRYNTSNTLIKTIFSVAFNKWEDVTNTSITNNTRNYIVVGEQVRYYVQVSANATPSSVKINGTNATRGNDFSGSNTSNTTWYITYSKDSKGIYDMEVEATVEGETAVIKTTPMTVYGLTVGSAVSTLDTSGNTMYLMRNTNYQSTNCTSINTSLAANTSRNYFNLFVVEGQTIKSVARNQYFNGTNGTISFNSTGTTYNISPSDTNIQCSVNANNGIWSTTYYIRQSSNTEVTMGSTGWFGTDTIYNNWNFLPVTYDIP